MHKYLASPHLFILQCYEKTIALFGFGSDYGLACKSGFNKLYVVPQWYDDGVSISMYAVLCLICDSWTGITAVTLQ